jgi:hypothetical protein
VKFLHRPRRVTPAAVISCIALFVALGGTGYAATTVIHNTNAPTATAARSAFSNAQKSKIKSIVRSLASSLSVKSAKSATTATTATSATTATQAGTANIAGTAGTANTAGSASTATTAGTSDNALNLGGQAPAYYTHLLSTGGLRAVAYNAPTTTTPALIQTIGPFTVNQTCTSTGGGPTNTATLTVTGPAGSVITSDGNPAVVEPATPVAQPLALKATTGTTFGQDLESADLVGPTGAVYSIESAIAETNPPSTTGGSGCAFSVLALQG